MECISWENIRASITDGATKTIGFTKNNKNHRIHNPVVKRLSNQQKELRFRISSTVNNEKVRELKTQRNGILHDIANMLNEDKNCELDNLASEINKCHNDNTKMYQAIKFINRKPLQNLMVHDKADRNVTEPNAVYKIIKDHFKANFNDPKESKLEPFTGNPRPLDTPIIKDEVAKSIHKLQNKRAPGYDQIPPELLKYAPTELHDLITESLNNIFAKHKHINVGHGLLTAMQKPGKPNGLTKTLRPVILLIMLRKAISNTVLTRIQPKCLSSRQKHFRHSMVP